MGDLSIDQLYEQQIRLRPRSERLRLLARIADDLVIADDEAPLSLLDLEGLGADIWHDLDAQQYLDQLRDEWDRP